MPKKKAVPQEELEQTSAELPEQADTETAAPEEPSQEGPPLEAGVPDDGLPMEEQEPMPALPDGAPDGLGEVFDSPPEVMEMDLEKPVDPPDAIPGDAPADGQLMGVLPPAEESSIAEEPPLVPDTVPAGDTPPMTDRQSFFALDFRELDRDLSPEERQAWNSIYASFRGRSALVVHRFEMEKRQMYGKILSKW